MPVPVSITSAELQDLDLRITHGEWPEDIAGEMVVSSPEPNPDLPYVLFGFGAMTRISLRPGMHGAPSDRFALRSRVIDTPSKRLYDAGPEHFVPQSFGYATPYGSPNQVNTAPLPWGDRLFATWDVGRPTEIDPLSLGFVADVGHRDMWGEQTFPVGGELLPFYFSSAHPVVDPDRDCLWTVKQMPADNGAMQLILIRWNGEGTSFDSWPIDGGFVTGSSHTISQTEHWIVLADSGNFKTDLGEILGGPRTATIDEGAPVYLIRKSVLDDTPSGTAVTPTVSAVAPTTGHFYAVWDDRDGIRVIFEHMDLMDLGFHLNAGDLDANGQPINPALIGMYNTAMAPNSLTEVTFDPISGASRQTALFREDWTFNLQLSAMDWSKAGLAAPTRHHIAYQGYRPGAITNQALDLYRAQGRVPSLPTDDTPGVLASFDRDGLNLAGSYEFTDTDDHITSPIFVRRTTHAQPGGHDGYVVLPVLSDNGFRVELFSAGDVGAGPICTLSAPNHECLPVMLHAAWMPAANPAPDHDRLTFADDLVGTPAERVRAGSADVAAIVDRVAAGLA